MYGCVRQLYFLQTRIEKHSHYPNVEATIKSDPDARFLDLGSCFATDTRKVIVDGWKETNIVAADVIPDFWNYGLALHEDASDIKCKVAIGDVTSDSDFVKSLVAEGLFAHVWNGAVLHVLTEEKVEALLRAVYSMLRPGGSYFGDCVGTSAEPGQWEPPLRNRTTGYHHSSESLKQTLERIGFEEVEVRGVKLDLPGLTAPPDRLFLCFSAKKPQ